MMLFNKDGQYYHCSRCGARNYFSFFEGKSAHIGIYCKRCGTWLKWASKSERRIYQDTKLAKETGD